MLRFEFVKKRPAFGSRALDDFSCGHHPGRGNTEIRHRRRLVKTPQMIAVTPQVLECTRGRIGVGERRNASAVQNVDGLVYGFSAHETGDQRLACLPGVRRKNFGNTGGFGDSLRRHDHQQSVALRILGDDFDCLGIAVRSGIAQDVHRIRMAPMRRQDGIERFQRMRRKNGKLSTRGDQ